MVEILLLVIVGLLFGLPGVLGFIAIYVVLLILANL